MGDAARGRCGPLKQQGFGGATRVAVPVCPGTGRNCKAANSPPQPPTTVPSPRLFRPALRIQRLRLPIIAALIATLLSVDPYLKTKRVISRRGSSFSGPCSFLPRPFPFFPSGFKVLWLHTKQVWCKTASRESRVESFVCLLSCCCCPRSVAMADVSDGPTSSLRASSSTPVR